MKTLVLPVWPSTSLLPIFKTNGILCTGGYRFSFGSLLLRFHMGGEQFGAQMDVLGKGRSRGEKTA